MIMNLKYTSYIPWHVIYLGIPSSLQPLHNSTFTFSLLPHVFLIESPSWNLCWITLFITFICRYVFHFRMFIRICAFCTSDFPPVPWVTIWDILFAGWSYKLTQYLLQWRYMMQRRKRRWVLKCQDCFVFPDFWQMLIAHSWLRTDNIRDVHIILFSW